ncbi:hypothetical protein E2C01_003664 [Portunus trituberculatus]|uniref:Uncharacterized protein n=1 Tax=Portunus trituberculatus TaxID=210409 RepID=A0A5B7CQC6_PORTR|nr:hypothetical protein [Portunus trituberculatus]
MHPHFTTPPTSIPVSVAAQRVLNETITVLSGSFTMPNVYLRAPCPAPRGCWIRVHMRRAGSEAVNKGGADVRNGGSLGAEEEVSDTGHWLRDYKWEFGVCLQGVSCKG